jgi:hypothetical protein
VDVRIAGELSRYFRDDVLRETEMQWHPHDRGRLQPLADALDSACIQPSDLLAAASGPVLIPTRFRSPLCLRQKHFALAQPKGLSR